MQPPTEPEQPLAPAESVRELVARLPPDVLLRIFAKLPKQDRLLAVPAVCRRWQAVATEPSSLFSFVKVDLTLQNATPLQPSLESWLAARAGWLQTLTLQLPPADAAKAALAVAALTRAGPEPRLRFLEVDFGGVTSTSAADLLRMLAIQPLISDKLATLIITGIQGELRFSQLGVALQLPRLQDFDLEFADVPAGTLEDRQALNNLPEGFPAFLLTCRELECISIENAGLRPSVVSYCTVRSDNTSFGTARSVSGPLFRPVVTLRVRLSAGPQSLRTLPEGLGQLQRLRQLVMFSSGVEAQPVSLTSLTNLQILEVVDSPARDALRLPPSLAALTRLTEVWLSCARVPAALSTLPHLKLLKLSDLTAFEDREAELAQLLDPHKLQHLQLSSCQLETLPAAVMRQASLRELDVANCKLRALPPGPYLQQLEHLNLSINSFPEVPPAALAAPQLRTLEMLHNEPLLQLAGRAGTPELAAEVAALNARLPEHPV